MQNVKPTDLSCVSDHVSPVSAVINRVAAIAPAPLLPGEQEADYAEFALASSKTQTEGCDRRPSDARRHRLILGDSSASSIEGRTFAGLD